MQHTHDLMGRLIHYELSKRLKFDHANKWYIHKTEYFIDEKNKTHWNSEIQNVHSILA